MSVHINAEKNAIADVVLLPGDPLRAKYIAESFLSDATCYSSVRNMFGYTGHFKGKKISVQGTGMGLPSLSIYTHELINDYGVKNLIRVGSCGSFQKEICPRDLIFAQASCTDSAMNRLTFHQMDFAPIADFNLLSKAYYIARDKNLKAHVGNILATDRFYQENADSYQLWSKHGVLGVEMESSALYTICAKAGVSAVSLLTVSDSLITGESLTSHERESSLSQMIEIALELSATL